MIKCAGCSNPIEPTDEVATHRATGQKFCETCFEEIMLEVFADSGLDISGGSSGFDDVSGVQTGHRPH